MFSSLKTFVCERLVIQLNLTFQQIKTNIFKLTILHFGAIIQIFVNFSVSFKVTNGITGSVHIMGHVGHHRYQFQSSTLSWEEINSLKNLNTCQFNALFQSGSEIDYTYKSTFILNLINLTIFNGHVANINNNGILIILNLL